MLEAKVYCFEFRPKKPQIDQKLWTTFRIFSLWKVLDAVDTRSFFGVPVKSLGYYGSIKLCGRSVASKLSVHRQTTKLTQKWFFSKNAPPRKSSEGIFFGHSTWNCYTLSILNMYVKGVSRTFLSALLTSAILVISELGNPNYIVKSAILIFWFIFFLKSCCMLYLDNIGCETLWNSGFSVLKCKLDLAVRLKHNWIKVCITSPPSQQRPLCASVYLLE